MDKFLTVTLNLWGAGILAGLFLFGGIVGVFTGEKLSDIVKVLVVSGLFASLSIWTKKNLKKENPCDE
jgi:hypothetical protein